MAISLNRQLAAAVGLKRMALHAWRMGFHPLSAEPLEFIRPLPANLRTHIAQLDAQAPREFSADTLVRPFWSDNEIRIGGF